MCSLYQTEVVRTREGVEALREAWKAMPSRLDADIDFFLEFMRVHSDFVLRPHVVVLSTQGRIAAILPGRLERQPLRLRVGYTWLALPTVNQITFVGQLLGENCKQAASEALNSIHTSLHRKEADVVLFHQVDAKDSIYNVVQRTGGILTRGYFQDSEESWKAQIPGDYEAFLKARSSNTRYNIKRYSKRLLQAFPGKVQCKILGKVDDLQVIFRDCETVAGKSYHRSLGVGFFDNYATRQLFSTAAAQGWLRSYILYLDGRPSAFWNGFLYRNTFMIRDTAYEAELSELRPGLYLLQRLIEDLCACGAVRELDFGPGSAQYKQDMCEISARRVSQLLFAPTLKGICMNAVRTPLLALSRAAKWVLTRLGFFQRAKKLWRSRLAANASAGGSRRLVVSG